MEYSFPYLKVLKYLLLAISERNLGEVRDFSNELLNLIMIDKKKITDFESEVAEELVEELELILREEVGYGG